MCHFVCYAGHARQKRVASRSAGELGIAQRHWRCILGYVMKFGLLGPVVVRCGETVLPVPRGKQRALLAVLLLNPNRVVPVDEIADTFWGAGPPPSASVTIRNYVKRLRQALGEEGQERISFRKYGYLIRVGEDELDVAQFGNL